MLPTLDAHAHLDPDRWPAPLPATGCVLAASLSPLEYATRAERNDELIAWGLGCHPRQAAAQEEFHAAQFGELLQRTAFVGEIGLDGGSAVPAARQRATFGAILTLLADRPRIVSVHGHQANGGILDELERTPIIAPILHRFQGTAAQASRAMELGCYFSIHAQVARRSLFRSRVPLDRILVETDHGYDDPPAAIPLRSGWVEFLVAQQYEVSVETLREQLWRNFARIVTATGTRDLLPRGIAALLPA